MILVPNVVQDKQLVLLREAIKRLARCGDTVNKVLEVDIRKEDIIFSMYDFPATKRNE